MIIIVLKNKFFMIYKNDILYYREDVIYAKTNFNKKFEIIGVVVLIIFVLIGDTTCLIGEVLLLTLVLAINVLI